MRRLILLMTMAFVVLGGLRLSAEPETGVWNTDFSETLEYAKAEGLPIVVVWGNTTCGYCTKLVKALEESSELEDWLAEHEVLLVLKHEKYGSKDADYLAAKDWIKSLNPSISGFPFVGIYQQRPDGTVLVSTAFTGRSGTMPATDGTLAEQFVGSLDVYLSEAERASLRIVTETIAPLSTVEDRDIRLEAKHADGVCRWRHEERGYDVTSVTNADVRLEDSGFEPLTGDEEVELAFDFPVNGRAVRTLFIGSSPMAFANVADGLRADLRPYVAEFEMTGEFTSVAVKQGADYAVFRWQGAEVSVLVLLDATGSVRYAYEGFETTPAASFSVLDGTEWHWAAAAAAAAHDYLFRPRTLSEMPDGLELSGDGAVIGAPTTTGSGSFRVRAEDSADQAAVAEIAYAVQDTKLTPYAPDEAEASDRTFVDKVLLTWTGDDTAQLYEIYRSETGSFEDAEFVDSTAECTYADMECEAEVDYCYFIRGVNGDFAGDFATVWGKRAQELYIATEILPPPAAKEIYDETLEGEGGQGALRWEAVPNGYDVSNAVPDRSWAAYAFEDADGDSEYALPFAFPINDSRVSSVFVQANAELFFNCADGVRASLRPFVAPTGRAVEWSAVQVRSLGDRVTFRWEAIDGALGNMPVMVELFADGRIRYSYAAACEGAGDAGYAQELTTLDGVEWAWRGAAADFATDRVFTPQKYGALPDGLELSADGNLLGVATTNAADAIVCIRLTDELGESRTRAYGIEVTGTIPSPEAAVGCDNLSLTFEETPWFVEEGESSEGKFALQSGAVGNKGKSIVKTTVYGSGLLTFSWKTTSLPTDKTSFFIDGTAVTNVTGNSEWTTVTVNVTGNGEHTLSWQFLCGKTSVTTDGCAWLDDVCWTPRELTLEMALGQSGLRWETTGDAEWLPEEDEDGKMFGMSGPIGDDGYSEVSTTVSGAGTLTFEWKASSEDWDYLVFRTNDVSEAVAVLSGSTGWEKKTFAFGAGEHVFRWSYEKDERDFYYDDCAYLANVIWTPAPENPTIEVHGHSLTVPAEWVTSNFPEVTSMGAAAEQKLMATAANGKNTVWECYVAGLDPNAEPGEENAEFTAKVEMVDGKPVITWSPDLNENGTKSVRSYKVMGAVEIGGPWVEVPEGKESEYNFFSVTVDMPE